MQPVIGVQIPQKRVRQDVPAQIAPPCFFDECQRPLPHSAQFRQHLFLLASHLRFHRARRFAPDDSRFHDHHRQMKSFVERHGLRRFLKSLVGPAQDGPLDRAQVADELAGRPSPFSRPRFPLLTWHATRSPHQFRLRAGQVFNDGFQSWHGLIQIRAKDSQRGASGLLKSMRELQDARLGKSRPKNL